jgi:hypothetical protein
VREQQCGFAPNCNCGAVGINQFNPLIFSDFIKQLPDLG